ncbi:hypothetical protein SSPO_071520 [Streptomyces antimycoticus]|uniref:Amine oxidase domain-containing protein n=1 Tax=Streptomyces antimycoticus TaxID=68175 RepID=A0A499UR82_9ACTN|nr:hypothetical protein SSPO_071520 [Streptomyces antimycoticus]
MARLSVGADKVAVMARIVVIGSGMGAMAAAARLAVAGHRVVVYERGRTHGGGVGRFARDGFRFDTGPGLLHLPAVYRDLFVKTGKQTLEQSVELIQVDPASRYLFADGTDVRLPNASRAGVLQALDGAFGAGAGERWSDLVNRAREVWDATRRPLLEEPLRADWRVLGRDPYPVAPVRRGRLGGLFGRGGAVGPPTLAGVARRELKDPRAVALLESHALVHGLDPRSAPAAATVLPYIEQTFGTWYVRGACGRSPMPSMSAAVSGRSSSTSMPRSPASWRRTAARRVWSWPTAPSRRPTRWSRASTPPCCPRCSAGRRPGGRGTCGRSPARATARRGG